MCGRFNLTASSEELTDHFELSRIANYEIQYNIPPGQKILNVVQLDDKSHKAVYLHWGLIPSWAKDRKIASHLINARSETLTEKPSFRNAFHKRRCLIPATGFFEWQQSEAGKQPYHIQKSDQSLFAFAGLWEHWDNNDKTLYSCTIITAAANTFMQPIHSRMPVVVHSDFYNLWLNKSTDISRLQKLMAASSYDDFQYNPVSTRVNNPTHNDSKCLTPLKVNAK